MELDENGELRMVADDFQISRLDKKPVFRLREMEVNLPGPDVMRHLSVSRAFVDRVNFSSACA